jgi:hypothetical protein
MPTAAMLQAMVAPNGPVAMPKLLRGKKIPAPTIDSTTIEVRTNNESFCVEDVAIALPSATNEAIESRLPRMIPSCDPTATDGFSSGDLRATPSPIHGQFLQAGKREHEMLQQARIESGNTPTVFQGIP